jgi:hypothetical protein
MTSYYEQIIRETLARIGRIGAADPRWIEGWMRLERGTLDALSAGQFRQEVEIALECIAASAASENESLAVSYGL